MLFLIQIHKSAASVHILHWNETVNRVDEQYVSESCVENIIQIVLKGYFYLLLFIVYMYTYIVFILRGEE